jgi:hypothetical protein
MTPERRALLVKVLTPKPEWNIIGIKRLGRGKARHAVGELHGRVVSGMADTADAAIAAYLRLNPLAPKGLEYRALKRNGHGTL